MALINCPECNREISDTVNVCPHCGYSMKRKSKSRIIPIIGIFAVLLLIILVLIMVIIKSNGNNMNKAKKYYENGNIDEFQTLKPELEEDEIKEFSEYLQTEVDGIKENYLAGTVTYEEAVDNLEALIKYGDTVNVANYDDTLKEIKERHSSSEAYKSAQKLYEEGKLSDAYSKYAKVIEIDGSYEDAQSKMKEIKESIINEHIEKAKQYADEEKYTGALSEINRALQYSEDDKELSSLKNQYLKLKNQKDQEKEEEDKRDALLTEGKVIANRSIEATFIGASLVTRVNPDNTGGAYIYYYAEEGEIWLDLKFRLKNVGSSNRLLENIVTNVKATYNHDYKYDRYSTFTSSGSDIDQVYSWDALEPLKETTYHLVLKLPDEVNDSDYPLEVEFMFDNEKQYLKYR